MTLDAQRLLAMATSDMFQQLVADAHRYEGVLSPIPSANTGPGGSAAPNR